MPKPLPDTLLCLHCMETRSHKRLKAHVPAALSVCVCVYVRACVHACVRVRACVNVFQEQRDRRLKK